MGPSIGDVISSYFRIKRMAGVIFMTVTKQQKPLSIECMLRC